MSMLSAQPVALGASGHSAPRDLWRSVLLPAAWIFGAYFAGIHLAAGAGALPAEGHEAGAVTGPACVGCHHGPDDGAPAPEGGLASPERDALTNFVKEMGR